MSPDKERLLYEIISWAMIALTVGIVLGVGGSYV